MVDQKEYDEAMHTTYMYGNIDVNLIEVDKERYEELLEKEMWLEALETAGVDNWDGFDYAQEIYSGLNAEDS